MPEVICNSSCVIALDSIGRLDILKSVYQVVQIPEAVDAECGLEIPGWIKVEPVANSETTRLLHLDLGKGESEAIALALEKDDSLLILDDKKARRIAAELGLKVTGTLGVLLRAKKAGTISQIKEMIEELDKKNFRVSLSLREEALKLAGER